MPFDIPASEQEKSLVHEKMSELKESLARSADLAEALISSLNENFLAIDKEYRKELMKEYEKIGSAMWQANMSLHKMLQHKSRIIGTSEHTE